MSNGDWNVKKSLPISVSKVMMNVSKKYGQLHRLKGCQGLDGDPLDSIPALGTEAPASRGFLFIMI